MGRADERGEGEGGMSERFSRIKAACEGVAIGLAIGLFVIGLYSTTTWLLPGGKDEHSMETDGDMQILTDHRTGCQYLTTSGRTLTPRLDAAGRQMCGLDALKSSHE